MTTLTDRIQAGYAAERAADDAELELQIAQTDALLAGLRREQLRRKAAGRPRLDTVAVEDAMDCAGAIDQASALRRMMADSDLRPPTSDL